jgi:hypothetical protein
VSISLFTDLHAFAAFSFTSETFGDRVGCGAAAVVLGFLDAGFSAAEGLKPDVILGLVAILVGAYSVLTGLGLVGGPCA